MRFARFRRVPGHGRPRLDAIARSGRRKTASGRSMRRRLPCRSGPLQVVLISAAGWSPCGRNQMYPDRSERAAHSMIDVPCQPETAVEMLRDQGRPVSAQRRKRTPRWIPRWTALPWQPRNCRRSLANASPTEAIDSTSRAFRRRRQRRGLGPPSGQGQHRFYAHLTKANQRRPTPRPSTTPSRALARRRRSTGRRRL